MKKILSAVLCLILCLSCISAFAAETPEYARSAALMVEQHDRFLESVYGDGQGYPLKMVDPSEYPGCVAYSTESRMIDLLFEPWNNGEGLQLINIIIFRDDLESDDAAFEELMKHLIGIMFLYLPDMAAVGDTDTFTNELVTGVVEAMGQPEGASWESAVVDFGGVAEVVAYVQNETFGIYIWFYEPISHSFLEARLASME